MQEQIAYAREGAALIDPCRPVSLAKIRYQLLGFRLIHSENFHKLIHKRRAGKAAERFQWCLHAVLSESVLHAFGDSLHSIKHGTVKIK